MRTVYAGFAAAAVLLLAVPGCGVDPVVEYVKEHPNISPAVHRKMLRREPAVGMEAEALQLIWGKPQKITRHGSRSESWLYKRIMYDGAGKGHNIAWIIGLENGIVRTVRCLGAVSARGIERLAVGV